MHTVHSELILGVWSRDGRHRFETFAAEGMSQCGETAAFGVGQVQPAPAELGSEGAVFREELRHACCW
jgi:hypothetical protein